MKKTRVLFVCVHNSARSQIAEAYLNNLAGEKFEAESAGLETGLLNPLVVEVMKEEGIDISRNSVKDVNSLLNKGKSFDLVITVCDEGNSNRCPVFPGKGKRIAWMFDDPSRFSGTYEGKLDKTRKVRDQIREKIQQLITGSLF